MSSLDHMSTMMTTSAIKTNLEQTNDERCIPQNSIEAFYADAVILITGATGFLGKALVEKLLRSCSRLATIFILIRPKKGQTVDQRLQQLLQNSVFDRLRVENPSVFEKIHPIKGDVTMPDLGLLPEDKQTLIRKVNIVFHSAATVRFDEPLKVAVNLNTKGTNEIIDLCKSMKNLISFIHVSTAYSNANLKEINEAVYTTKVQPSTVINMCEDLDDSTIEILEQKILENHPNTYTFTKNLAEQLLLTRATQLPVAIVRPSIVGAARKDPFPGWVDNLNGITGVMMEISKGTLKTIAADPDIAVEIVPVDYVIDTLICAAWHMSMQQNNSIKIYNCTSKNIIRVRDYLKFTLKHSIQLPTKYMVWYPSIHSHKNKLIVETMTYILNYIPALVLDLFSNIMGRKAIMFKTAKRMSRTMRNGTFFVMNEWKFQRDNMDDLSKKAKALKDSNNFDIDRCNHNWDTYVRDYILGIRKYIMHDTCFSKFQSRVSLLYFIHRLTQVSSILFLLVIILRFSH
ncbi:putative fatty acyl-CoA reductase CG5065 [Nomia melanderi]|uniref:putative fatty acyl-CoA reductase CG5065 n=1 Tax=Nomia melanderi TaxID=2448451 RepID=UPI001304557E|nr:putative fatty acyl-CoA reductase CG5065 [Nomia melanderi]XP_031827529.1 putative fatty acyl-CoA reductase CG5065 [Nomia melanderi]